MAELATTSTLTPEALAAVRALVAERDELAGALSDPTVHADPARSRALGRRYAALAPVADTYARWTRTGGDLQAARELAEVDPSFAAEAATLTATLDELSARLHELLAPRDPLDVRDVIVELKAGEGGEESALFVGDLLRMYLRYAERRGWRTEVLDAVDSGLGGYKDVSVAVKGRSHAGPDDAPYARLKFEGGVHRVQRVPVTESAGRIHTSAAGVLVAPEAEEVDVTIDPADLRVDVYRSSGPGGQSVNTTDSAVRITHLPTGIVVSCQNEKSQLQNKEQALRILRARLLARAREEADAAAADVRHAQVRTVDRSERIRTYNFPENRISDHRVGYKAYNLDQVLDGDLDAIIEACLAADRSARLAAEQHLSGGQR